ncbi:MAG: hypothetical protein LBF16_01885 [Pseudomonadales bacterium]|jgi:hypothetical protein|nr:hypothetical protein [Pseudomonadales bacterium]
MNTLASALVSQAQAFFDRYAQDFDCADWFAFSSHYHEPAFSVRADGSVAVLSNRSAVADFFKYVWSTWRAEGYSRFGISDLSAVPVGEQSALITFTWHLLRDDGSQIRQWNQSYQLLQVSGVWKVLSSTFHKA